MADIIYTYKNQVYANITNKCDCACTFCIRSQTDAIGEATSLWHKVDPTYEQITLTDMMSLFSAVMVNLHAHLICWKRLRNM